MEKFKAVEKEMKTKAYSKEGLLASARLDPKSQQKQDMVSFLSDCTAELDRQIESCEAEAEGLAVTLKKGKKGDSSKADRVAEVERIVERHKWHQGKLELIMRLLENGQLEVESVERIKEDIKWYVESNQDVDFMVDEDENIYDELNLDEEIAEDIFGMGMDADRMSSQDTTSQQDDISDNQAPIRAKEVGNTRRPSTQVKSPMPIPLTMHTPSPAPSFGVSPSNGSVKPAPLPTRPGELKYASVATAAAAADRNVGIAPLPPPPGQAPVQPAYAPPANVPKQSTPIVRHAQLAQHQNNVSSTPSHAPETDSTPVSEQSTSPKPNGCLPSPGAPPAGPLPEIPNESSSSDAASSPGASEAQINGTNGTNGTYESAESPADQAKDDCVFHLPPGLQDLMESFEATKKRLLPNPPGLTRSLELSYLNAPDSIDAEKPKHYKPTQKYNTPNHYPQEPLPIFDDPALYRRVDTDTLFYVFYYRQGTYQQYLAAKELKRQSWRFHKQYQTWFQRHEEPKTITEEYEQGTYRFFDYESTWLVSWTG